jgi:pimeloyl-ACP methyl ester carboxylesterase
MTTTVNETPIQLQNTTHRRGCLFYVRRVLKWIGIGLLALVLLGIGYQTIATEIDRRTYAPRGQLYTVNDLQMHMICVGDDTPSVILQAGGGADSMWWYWVQNQLAAHTRVCAYGRAGLGWSEAASTQRDPVTIVGELHALLLEADVQPPYIMVGHSYGTILARVYATQYPQEVMGLALVDSYTVRIVDQSELDSSALPYHAATGVLWVMQRLGVARFIQPRELQMMGYPPEVIPEMAALRARNQTLDTDIGEKGMSIYLMLARASADAGNLGDLPVAVLWAADSYATYDMDTMLEVSAYSSNSVTRVIEGANHGSILGTEQYAQQVSNAILDVIEAAQTSEPLAQ